MKKLIHCMLFFALLALSGCASSSNPAPDQQSPGEATLRTAQENYGDNIILSGAQRYRVVEGDTLSRIARARYNNGYYYPLIFLASRDMVQHPDRIYPGMVLTIPDLPQNLSDREARGSIRSILLEMAAFEEQGGRSRTAAGMRNLANGL